MFILGISCFYHDSAACILHDGSIAAAAQEERFTRKKHDAGFPENAIKYCLQETGIKVKDIDYAVYYDKPFLSFERLLLTYLTVAPKGIKSWLKSMPLWLGQKMHVEKEFKKKTGYDGDVLYTEHHESHAASAFYPSPFDNAAILTIDGVGEWASSSYGIGENNKITLFSELHFPDSVGLLYSAFTYFTGFKVNSGEYKLMGLAPYGTPRYKDLILSEIIDLKPDGSIRLNMKYFDFLSGLRMTNRYFDRLFKGPPRKPEAEITRREMDIAASIQSVVEEIVVKMVNHVYKETGLDSLCLAGGVALNCCANKRILKEGPFKNIWIQPASGDAGGALGAALSVWHGFLGNERHDTNRKDSQKGSYLGPSFSESQIEEYLEKKGFKYHKLNHEERAAKIAELISDELIIGHMAGRMEFGPRALGNRSILGDPRREDTQRKMNLKIKYRESFRPFAPGVIHERAGEYFDIDRPSPYMLFVADLKKDRQIPQPIEESMTMQDRLNFKRSEIPAVTHLDYTARIQTVSRENNEKFYNILCEFERLTGCPMLVNTSFNVRGEPIVCSPEDACRCFMRTEMDVLVIEDFILFKEEQEDADDSTWRQNEYEPD